MLAKSGTIQGPSLGPVSERVEAAVAFGRRAGEGAVGVQQQGAVRGIGDDVGGERVDMD